MPEATVHEANGPEAGKDDIWSAGKIGAVKAVAYASRMQRFPKHQFGSGIPALDTRHHPRSRCSVYDVGHREAFTFKTEPGKTCFKLLHDRR